MNWISPVLLLACLGLVLPGSAWAALERLDQTDFPCETTPPKCPSSVGFLLQVKNLLGGEVIDIDLNEQIDIENYGLCDELYLEAGGNLTVPIDGLNADFFYIRQPGHPYDEHVHTALQVSDIALGGNLNLVGENCLLLIDFNIPIAADITLGVMQIQSRTAVWLDTDTDEVVLTDSYSDAVLGDLDYDLGLGEMIEGLLFPFIYDIVTDQLAALVEDDGLVFNFVETIMDELYHVQPACMMVPMHRTPPVRHIMVWMAPFLLPMGFVLILKRRTRK